MALHQCRTVVRILAPAVAALGGVAALVGTYWDDAWHTDRGRDSIAAPPHLVLYVGVAVAIVAVGVQLARPFTTASRLALAGGIAVLASAPIDEFWHLAFGRDAVLWSPPHLLAVAASAKLATGVLSIARGSADRVGRTASVLAGAAVMGSFQVVVLEFDSDVPQFPTWTYLPVAIGAWLLSVEVIERITGDRRFLLATAATYTAIRASIVLMLDGLSHSGSIVPPIMALVLLHIGVEWAGSRRAAAPLEAAGGVVVWFVWLELFGAAGTPLDLDMLISSVGVVLVAGVAPMAVSRLHGHRVPSPLTVVVVVGALVAFVPEPAAAHDPGQGTDRYEARLEATRTEDDLMVRLDVVGHRCIALVPRRTVARRAGETVVGPLAASGSCRFEGRVSAPGPGRWFVYVELEDQRGNLELWVPIADGASDSAVSRALYQPAGRPMAALGFAVGVLLYSTVIVMIVGVLRSAKSIGQQSTRSRARR